MNDKYEKQKKYFKTKKGRKSNNKAQSKYSKTDKGRKSRRNYYLKKKEKMQRESLSEKYSHLLENTNGDFGQTRGESIDETAKDAKSIVAMWRKALVSIGIKKSYFTGKWYSINTKQAKDFLAAGDNLQDAEDLIEWFVAPVDKKGASEDTKTIVKYWAGLITQSQPSILFLQDKKNGGMDNRDKELLEMKERILARDKRNKLKEKNDAII